MKFDPLLLDLPTSIATARIDLRVPASGDGATFLQAVGESLPQLREFLGYLPWVCGEQTVDAAEAYCRNAQANFIARKDLLFFMFERASGKFLGATGLHRPNWDTPKIELGYWCRTGVTGQGFVAEAVTAVADYAFKQAKVVRLEAFTDDQNVKSRRVLERANFVLEGTMQCDRRALDGSVRNTCIYAQLRHRP